MSIEEQHALLLTLPNGGQCEIRSLPRPVYSSAFWQATTLHVVLGSIEMTLALHQRSSFAEAASLAGYALASHEIHPQPLKVYVALAYLALCQDLPSPEQLVMMEKIATVFEGKIPLSSLRVTTQEIRHGVSEELASLHQETLLFPEGLWNVARAMIATGELLWQLRGEQAAHWGSYPSVSTSIHDAAQQQRLQLALFAALVASPKRLASLPLPVSPSARIEQVWLDYISIAAGSGSPSAELRPLGLGTVGNSALENADDPKHNALTVEQGEALHAIAAAVLAASSHRPARYLTRVLEIDIPHHLIPQLRQWDIEHLLIQVEQNGMYVSARDQTGNSMSAAWWKADAASSQRTPLSFTPASWALLHPVCSSFWHDLREDGIVLERADFLTTPGTSSKITRTHRKGATASSQKRKIYLPPIRVKAHWASESDRRTLATVTAGGHDYRRLPVGWEERERDASQSSTREGHIPSILRRREEAAKRAREHGKLPPPPGWTYVAPFFRGGKPENDLASPRIPEVRARGLFSLVLGLQANSIRPLESDFHEYGKE